MKKYFVLIFIFFNYSVFSQTDSLNNRNHFPIKISKPSIKNINLSSQNKLLEKIFVNTDLNILMGATQFFGDIKQNDWMPSYNKENNFSEIQSAIEISLTKKINPLLSMQATAIMGRFGGLKQEKIGEDYTVYEPYPSFYEGNGEFFITDFKELDLQLLLNLSNASAFFTESKTNKYTFYLKTGIGLNIFNSLNRNLESENYIYSWGYEEGIFEQNDDFIKKSFANSPKETVYIYGLMAEYRINDKFSLIFDITKRKVNSDLWDAHNNNANEDNFNFYAIGTSYNIGGRLQNEEWVTPLEGIQQEIGDATANIEWLSEDGDSDGVADVFDKDPNTPIGVAVDGSGIALDIDMDNVPDYLDRDPFSSKGSIVDENGVEFDGDNDGVPDSKDLEVNTEIGAVVNQYGITISSTNIISSTSYFPSIFFDKGSYYIDNSNIKRIATIAIMMKNNPNIRLNVIGNTDQTGSSRSNKRLARKRAEEVVNYLSYNFGINKKRFVIKSNGETKLLSDKMIIEKELNINLDYINRRVDFQVTY